MDTEGCAGVGLGVRKGMEVGVSRRWACPGSECVQEVGLSRDVVYPLAEESAQRWSYGTQQEK